MMKRASTASKSLVSLRAQRDPGKRGSCFNIDDDPQRLEGKGIVDFPNNPKQEVFNGNSSPISL